jgi:hypothetical protein
VALMAAALEAAALEVATAAIMIHGVPPKAHW